MNNLIKERLDLSICPICKEVSIDVRIVKDTQYGNVRICQKHYVQGDNLNEKI